MADGGFVAPEILAADVAEREPDAGVHSGVIHRINAGDGWMIAGDLNAVRRVDMGEVRAEDIRVAEDEVRDGI